jgi:ATP-dependent DNA helicase RecG
LSIFYISIINYAIVHRDYASNASIQVMVLSDRTEIWNPGRLPPQLTSEALREAPHASIPHNPLLFEPFFLTRYCEKAGTGTSDMVKGCRAKGLPEPTFTENSGQFVVTIWRDIFTKDFLSALYLNDRQMKAIRFVKEKGRITNTGYQKIAETTKKMATRDLRDLVDKEIMEQVGTTGRGTYYVLRKYVSKAKNEIEKSKGDLKGTKETRRRKGDTKGT